MSFVKKAQSEQLRKRRMLTGETPEEEASRLEREIAAHPVKQCPPGQRISSSRPGWSSKPLLPISEQRVAEGIAKKMMRKG
jgi:hypothetical protein